MKKHPVVRVRKPLGPCAYIMDFQLVAVNGGPAREDEKDCFVRLDSKGRFFIKNEDTGGMWERIPWSHAPKE